MAQQSQRARRVPAPAIGKHRRDQSGLNEIFFQDRRAQHQKHIAERKRVLLDQRDADAVIRRRGLQLAIEAHAKALAQRQSPGAIDPPAPGRMEDQLHAAGFVKEALGDNPLLGRHRAEHRECIRDIINDLFRRRLRHGDLLNQPLRRRGAVRQELHYGLPQIRDRFGQLKSARRRLAHPEWNGRRQALGIVDPNFAGADPANPPGAIAEQKNIAGETFDGKIFVDFPDESFRGEFHHIVVGGIGNRAAVGDRGQARAAARPEHAVDPISMDVSAAPAAPGFHALAKHFQKLLEILPAADFDTDTRRGPAATRRPRLMPSSVRFEFRSS